MPDLALASQRGSRQILRERRGKASPLLNGLGHILLLFVEEFVAPVLKLFRDGIRPLRLLHQVDIDLSDEVSRLTAAGHLSDGTNGVFLDTLVEFV